MITEQEVIIWFGKYMDGICKKELAEDYFIKLGRELGFISDSDKPEPKDDIDRYIPCTSDKGVGYKPLFHGMDKDDNGQYVLYDDHLKAIEHLEARIKELECMRSLAELKHEKLKSLEAENQKLRDIISKLKSGYGWMYMGKGKTLKVLMTELES